LPWGWGFRGNGLHETRKTTPLLGPREEGRNNLDVRKPCGFVPSHKLKFDIFSIFARTSLMRFRAPCIPVRTGLLGGVKQPSRQHFQKVETLRGPVVGSRLGAWFVHEILLISIVFAHQNSNSPLERTYLASAMIGVRLLFFALHTFPAEVSRFFQKPNPRRLFCLCGVVFGTGVCRFFFDGAAVPPFFLKRKASCLRYEQLGETGQVSELPSREHHWA